MRKYLFMLLAACTAMLTACSSDDDDKIMPVFSPNNTTITVDAGGGTKTMVVSNAEELNITQINDKSTSGSKTTETNVKSVSNKGIADSKNVTEGGWFTAVVSQVDGKYRKITFTVQPNTSTESNRNKYIHVSCGGNVYGLSLYLVQEKASSN